MRQNPVLLCLGAATLALGGCIANTVEIDTYPAAVTARDMATAQAAIAYQLKDPDSAKFRDLTGYSTSAGDVILCGEVNGTNSFGGYAGFQPFFVRLRAGKAVIATTEGAAFACGAAQSGHMKVSS